MKNPLLLTIISIIFSLSVILTFLVYSTHVDVAWYLHAADIWLDGGTLFKDVVAMNPQGIIFLNTFSVIKFNSN